jgi:hypothetical protein
MFKYFLTFIFVLINTRASISPELNDRLFEAHDVYKEKSLAQRRFKHSDILPLIAKHKGVFKVESLGSSFENREIQMLSIGQGATKIMLWSQMHGDEATATMALFDIFNLFEDPADELKPEIASILKNCTLYFVPMLNPDGSERFQRRTAQNIDMNRDALRFQTPEGKILKAIQDKYKPDFSFNLHDQGVRYSAGFSAKQATISFLATAYNFDRDWNKTRTQSMKVICSMAASLQKYIPGHIAKYSDEHEPRAFGDNVQKWGSSLILIESGGYKSDREKQFIRKLNFVAILDALHTISNKSYKKYKLADYQRIPNNERQLFSLLVRNASYEINGKQFISDIGINIDEKNNVNATGFSLESEIDDLGDLSTFYGVEEIDADGLRLLPLNEDLKKRFSVNENTKIGLGVAANFMLVSAAGPAYAVINGDLIKL